MAESGQKNSKSKHKSIRLTDGHVGWPKPADGLCGKTTWYSINRITEEKVSQREILLKVK